MKMVLLSVSPLPSDFLAVRRTTIIKNTILILRICKSHMAPLIIHEFGNLNHSQVLLPIKIMKIVM